MNHVPDNEKKAEISTLIKICSHDFQIEPKKNNELKNFKEVVLWLQNEIQYLLDHDFQKLVNAMYRIDIAENKFKEVLNNVHSESISKDLTELIIERELQKVELRRKYRSK